MGDTRYYPEWRRRLSRGNCAAVPGAYGFNTESVVYLR